jgi:hypothetical protein
MRVSGRCAPDLAAAGVLMFAFAATAYRDAAQAITIDEAANFLEYARRPLSVWISRYDAGNHVLHTLLCHYSVHAFGASEFAMRLPGLLGAALFFAAVFRLSRDLFERAWLRPLAAAALALNPFTLDYLSAARGYGLGLGFFFWALFLLFRHASGIDPRPAPVGRAAVALALSVASNLVFAFPATALVLVFTLMAGARRFWWVVDRLWGPAIVLAFVIVVLPLSGMKPGDLYFGAHTLGQMYRSLADESELGGRAGALAAAVVLGLVLVSFAAALRSMRVRGFAATSRLDKFLVLAAGTIGAAVLLMIVAHKGFGVLYPLSRTGIYFPSLAAIAAAASQARLLSMRPPGRIAGILCACLVGLAVLRFAAGFRTTYYAEWRFDAGSKRTAAVFGEILRKEGARRVAVGASWPLASSLQFYAAKYKWDALAVERMPLVPGQQNEYPYYLLLPEEAGLIAQRGLKPIYADPESGAIVASAR